MRFIMLAVVLLGLGFAGYAQAADLTASSTLAQHGLSATPQLAQGSNCATVCELAGSVGGANCPLAGAGGTTCIPVGTGCTCSGQLINSMGMVAGTAVKK